MSNDTNLTTIQFAIDASTSDRHGFYEFCLKADLVRWLNRNEIKASVRERKVELIAKVIAKKQEEDRPKDITPSDLAYRLMAVLGREKESPLGQCPRVNALGGGCIRQHGIDATKPKRYCDSCWGYVLACSLHAMISRAR